MTLTAPGQAAVKFQGTWECGPIAGGALADGTSTFEGHGTRK